MAATAAAAAMAASARSGVPAAAVELLLYCQVSRWKWLLVASWLASGAYTFSLPWWASLLNSRSRFGNNPTSELSPRGLCSTPAAEVRCYSGANMTQLLLAAGRQHVCGCGQGILGEELCSTHHQGFSISGYIATPVGTGAMATFSLLPILGMWGYYLLVLHCCGPSWRLRASGFCLLVFHVCFMLFLIFTICVFPGLHVVNVFGFIVAAVLHFLLLGSAAYRELRQTWLLKVVMVAVVSAVAALLLGIGCSLFFTSHMIKWEYGFWLGECVGLFIGFGLTPTILVLGGHLLPPIQEELARVQAAQAARGQEWPEEPPQGAKSPASALEAEEPGMPGVRFAGA